jgi:hypothetical protein
VLLRGTQLEVNPNVLENNATRATFTILKQWVQGKIKLIYLLMNLIKCTNEDIYSI